MSFNAAMGCVIGLALAIFAAGLYLLRLKEGNNSSMK